MHIKGMILCTWAYITISKIKISNQAWNPKNMVL